MEIVEELSCEFVQEAKLEHRESCNEVWEPKIGLLFDSEIAALKIYDTFAKRQGFGVITISTRKLNGVRHNVTYGCNRSRKYKPRGSNVIRILSTTKTDCPARINIVMMPDGRWRLNSFVIDHNHEFDIEAAKYLKSNRTLQPHVQREIEFNRDVGLRMNKTVSSATRQTGGPENLMWIEKDAQNHLDKVRRHELQGGDVQVMLSFFAKQQAENEDFYYAIDVDEFGCLARVFWADSRSREAYKWFGDVITFDTTYLVNQFDVPFAPFVGVNHHRMTILLGCGLVVQEDTDSFVWLFEQWLACMGGCHPSAIITDQDRAMQNAIAHVFPNTRHRWCLWHIMKKIPEKLKSYKEYKSIKSQLKNVVYDSLTTQEFEEGWQCFIDHYDLQDNGWLSSMYEERRRWIPAYVKDTFWAGMSTTQRSESLNAFFDGYVHSKTCLREFVEQYENALLKKVMQEEEQDANCKNRQKYNLSPYGFESQFQQAYTIAIFTIFLKQVGDLIGSHLTMGELKDDIREYFVEQDILVGKEHVFKTVNLIVHFNEESKDTNCTCRMFESVGIPCTHMICIWKNKKLTTVPDKYILHRWRKDMVRSHTKMKVSYSNWQTKPEWRRYDCLKRKFNKGVDQVIHSEKMSVWLDGKLDDIIQEAKAIRMVGENTEAVGANVGGSSASNKMPTLEEYGTNLTKLAEEGKLDPVVGRQEQIERVTQILGRRTKNNPCLIGEPGVGKTAIAEGLAQRIANGDVPETIEGKKVITLDMGLLVAGTKYRGESEERLKKLMEEVRQSDEIILFIDEVHTLIWAGPAANLLKPALARGELQCIGATTLDEYRTHIEKDPALERRFQPVKVPEPTVDETVQILKGLRERYEIHHKLHYTDEALVAAAKLSHRYISDRFLPDKAIDLVDEAGSCVRLRHARLPEDARELEKELRQITKEKNEAVRSQDFEKASELRDREIDLKTQISALVDKNKEMSKAETEVGDGGPVVTEADIQQIVSSWTGVPVEKVY